jgi:hypothetical protein
MTKRTNNHSVPNQENQNKRGRFYLEPEEQPEFVKIGLFISEWFQEENSRMIIFGRVDIDDGIRLINYDFNPPGQRTVIRQTNEFLNSRGLEYTHYLYVPHEVLDGRFIHLPNQTIISLIRPDGEVDIEFPDIEAFKLHFQD